MFSAISRLPEFEKDVKKLVKKYRTIEDDIDNFIRAQLDLYHHRNIDNGGVFEVTGLKIGICRIYKAKKFACRSLKGTGVRSGFRVIYAYFEEQDKIDLIEIYYYSGN